MNGLYQPLSGAWQMITKHKGIVCLLLLQIVLSLVLLGNLLMQTQQTQIAAEKYEDAYTSKTFYSTGEYLGDADYYSYLYDDGQLYKRIHEFALLLLNNNDFPYIMQMQQSIELETYFTDEFLLGYEEGYAQESSFSLNGEAYYITKSLQVSPQFFSSFDISVDQGREFVSSDYINNHNQKIPVLVGNDYREYMDIGDTFLGMYLTEQAEFEVIGFLGEDAFFYSRQDNEMVSCQRFIILPAMLSLSAQPTFFDRIRMLQQMEGLIVSDLSYSAISEQYNALKKQAGIENLDIGIRDPNAQLETTSFLETYSAMTQEVVRQFRIILAIAVFFVVISLSFTISGFIQARQYEYGIRMLAGASPASIVLDTVLSVGMIMIFSDLLALAVMAVNLSLLIALRIQLVVITIWILSSILPLRTVLRMDITKIIGGNE